VAGIAIALPIDAARQIAKDRDRLAHALEGARPKELTAKDVYGYPPMPKRPAHEIRLGGVYYRGNDERHPKLYNGGNYRTATLTLSLCDEKLNPLGPGDPIPPEGLRVQLLIERAPLATRHLFAPRIMSRVHLARWPDHLGKDEPFVAVGLTEVKPYEQWQATYPIPSVAGSDSTTREGWIYLTNRKPKPDRKDWTIYMAIRYALKSRNGKLSKDSDLWMGATRVFGGLHFPPDRKIVPREWFDHHPIPIIQHAVDDQDLLGIPEHLRPDRKTPDKKP